jgi:hypothetical protein
MSQFTFNLATPADDEQLGELLAATPMEGAIRVAFARRPSYFAAAAADGRTVQVGVARDRDSGRIVGMGSRAVGLRYVNGERVAVGYLGGLRLRNEYRGRAGLLARGYRFLRELHEDRRADYYLTTIAADNEASTVLTSARAGLPVYHPCGRFHTLAISAARFARTALSHDHEIGIRHARPEGRDAILAFLNSTGPARQYFPVYEPHDLFSDDGLLRGIRPDDVLLAFDDGQIVGTLACWNQQAFKQIVIHGYRGWLSPLRPLYNAWATLQRNPTLPAAGSDLSVCFGAIPVVRDDRRDVFERLLSVMLHQLAERGERLLLLGLHEADPLLPIARHFAGREYVTIVYVVYWPDDAPDVGRLVERVPYLELGSL